MSYDPGAVSVLASSVRAVLGATREMLSDESAVDLVLSPAKNSHLASALNETTLSRITRALQNVHYTFAKKISTPQIRRNSVIVWCPVLVQFS